MKAKPGKLVEKVGFVPCDAAEATHLKVRLPGPTGVLILPVMQRGTREGTPNWTWNGSSDLPTLHPSVLTTGGDWRCHSQINDGRCHFLEDCSHEMKGQTVELLEVE